MRAMLGSFAMAVPQQLPADPFDTAYRQAQLDLYAAITGHAYDTVHEATKFDVDHFSKHPFPFYTQSSTVAGEYFSAIGYVLEAMALPPGSRVLEFGPGWGWTSIFLAQLGHSVTIVDIEPCFCDLIARRAKHEGVEITVVNDSFFAVEQMEGQFDAVLFYDCFHHCDDHIRLLEGLHRIVAKGGRIFFGAEPIDADFPYPWGIRLDGWALWGVRKNGWMELGFRDDYFAQALARTGWFGRRRSAPGNPRHRVWEASRRDEAQLSFPATSGQIQTAIGRKSADGIVVEPDQEGMALYGPYVPLPPGRYTASIVFKGEIRATKRVKLDVTVDTGRTVLAMIERAPVSPLKLQFEIRDPASDLEVRLWTPGGLRATIESLEILPA
jgi:2-polyprenyl-3-methyl-5-hydroxy-6-metoxy-1,4-benzoquinol methylase